ncbi:hypothetical protein METBISCDRAFT_30583 [Metschnikowia bicuspidata]|uniref:Histone deacetylase complex subunit SAP30 Sin3 binding domain-containing protein n=1 Tax=Metschnikowia bicuspidata TaxID=27322 RepID=A0A4P9ZDA0_9ASCO|nr:hypothetical protein METBISCDRAFT_30583 [Metschnikowia bicuspidata]
MPPRGQVRDSTSESEAKTGSISRAANKARNAVAAAAQLEFLLKHIHSNGPKDKPPIDPLDFSTLSDKALRCYNKKYDLRLPEIQSFNDNILQSELGKKSCSAKKTQRVEKISKQDMAASVQKHFLTVNVRENEILAGFLYKVKHQNKDFKLNF